MGAPVSGCERRGGCKWIGIEFEYEMGVDVGVSLGMAVDKDMGIGVDMNMGIEWVLVWMVNQMWLQVKGCSGLWV